MENEKLVDNLLREELPFSLPEGFADKVASHAIRQYEWRQRFQQFLIFAVVIIGGLLIGGLTLYYFADENLPVWKEYLAENMVYLFQGLIAGIFILFVDKVLLPMFMHSANHKRNLRQL